MTVYVGRTNFWWRVGWDVRLGTIGKGRSVICWGAMVMYVSLRAEGA